MILRYIYVAAVIFVLSLMSVSANASDEYFSVSENYDTVKESYVLRGDSDKIVSNDPENTTTFLAPVKDSNGNLRLGYYSLGKTLTGTVTIDFRAKLSDESSGNYFGFTCREGDYTRATQFNIVNAQLYSEWRYYRVVIDFSQHDIYVYSSSAGFKSVGILNEDSYRAQFGGENASDITGMDRIQFHNCLIDDFSVYAGGTAPKCIDKPFLTRDGSSIKLNYEYSDAENDTECGTKIRWQLSDEGLEFDNIENEYGNTYRLSTFDSGKYIRGVISPANERYPQQGDSYTTEPYFIDSTTDIKVYDSSGNEITDLSPNMENLTVKIGFSPVQTADNITAVLAVYGEDGKMLDIFIEKRERSAGDTFTEFCDISLKNISENPKYFKGYIWESLNNLLPVDTIGEKNVSASLLARSAVEKLDLTVPELSSVKEYADSSNWLGALREYKKIFFDNLQKYAEILLQAAPSGSLLRAQQILKNDRITLTSTSGEAVTVCPGVAGSYNWFYPDVTFLGFGSRLQWLEDLIYAYSYTGDVCFLEKWLDIRADFDDNFKAQYDEHLKNGNYLCGQDIRFLKVGQLHVGGRILDRIQGLVFAVSKDRDTLERLFDDAAFAKMICAQSEDLTNLSLSTSTPNQFMYGVDAITRGEMLFPTMDVKSRLAEVNNTLISFIEENYLADGGESEMSFHYNYDTFPYYNSIKSIYDAKGETPSWLSSYGEYITKKVRLMSSVLAPTGKVPNLAKDYDAESAYSRLSKYAQNDETGSAVFNNLFGDKSVAAPQFTSVAFPYTGYYIMRDDWDSDSQYLFFNGTRFGSGHTEMNKLEVQYHAYGERLLMSSPESYSSLAEDEPYNNYFASGYGNNSVMVDGYSQHRNVLATNDFSTPEKGLWHTSESFDYADNTYENGYNTYIGSWDERTDKAISDVKHKRQVIMDKENILAVVVDEMQTEGEHSYSLIWNLDGKFDSADMVTADADGKTIKADAGDGKAGLELYNFGEGEISYSVSCGEQEGSVYKGWHLPQYGTDYVPSVHTETAFSGKGTQKIITLINPTQAGVSKITSCTELENGKGFVLTLEGGVTAICLTGAAEYGDISFNGNLLYLTVDSDGNAKGVSIGTNSLKVGDSSCTYNGESFEFTKGDSGISINNYIESIDGFSWNGTKPLYE